MKDQKLPKDLREKFQESQARSHGLKDASREELARAYYKAGRRDEGARLRRALTRIQKACLEGTLIYDIATKALSGDENE